ncbi:MAG TPA: DUF3078 domain-containing protein [Chitinophagaceae bacterium]
MKNYLASCLALLISWSAVSQDITVKKISSEVFRTVKKEQTDADTIPWTWKRGGLVNVNIAQGSLSNWAAGGDQFSFTLNSAFNYFILHKKGRRSWDNSFDFNLGFLKSTSLGSRKNDDRFDILSKYGYQLDSGRWYVTALGNFRSQFFDGYTYSGGKTTFSSSFLSPAYALASVGMDYKHNEKFSIFLSPVTSRWVIVANKSLADSGMYGVQRGHHVSQEFGGFASISYTTSFTRNVTYKGRADLFSNYRVKPGNIDVFMTNAFSFRINKYLSATYNLDLIYDDDVKLFGDNKDSPALQIKSLMGIGFLMRFAPVINPKDKT